MGIGRYSRLKNSFRIAVAAALLAASLFTGASPLSAAGYIITPSTGSGGTVQPPNPQNVPEGNDRSFSIVPDPGYAILDVLVDNMSVGPVTNYTFTNVTADHTISATFLATAFTVTFDLGTHGARTGGGELVQVVIYGGDAVAPIFDVEAGWTFTGWDTPFTNVTSDRTVSAQYSQIEYSLTINVTGSGAVDRSNPGPYNPNDVVQLTAVPDAGWSFQAWSGDLSGSNNPENITIDGAKTVTATFINTNTYTVTFDLGTHGTRTGGGELVQTVIYGGGAAAPIFDVESGWTFTGWDAVFTNITSNLMVTALYTPSPRNITASADANGSISPSGSVVVNYGADQAFSITPNTGYHIADVLVDGASVGATSNYTFTNVVADHTIAATFAINSYSLTYTAGAGGTIAGTSPQAVDHGGSGSQVTAVPDAGYYFIQWSDGVLTAARIDTNVQSNINVTASFTNNTTLSVVGIIANNKPYDGNTSATLDTSSASLAGVIPGDVVSLDMSGANATFDTKSVGAGKPVSVSGLTVTGPDAGKYTLNQPAGITAAISPASLTVNNVSVENKVYDGTTTATLNIGGATLVGVIGTEDVILNSASVTGIFADRNAGAAKTVIVSGLAINGADVANYTLTQPSAIADIAKATLTPTVTVADKVYNGTAAAVIQTRTISGTIDGDEVALTGGFGTFSDNNVGTAITVNIIDLGFSGASAANYQLSSTSAVATASITKAGLTVTAVDQTITAGSPDPIFTVTYAGFVNGETTAVLDEVPAAGVTVDHAAAGTYPIIASGGADNNYSFIYINGTLIVTASGGGGGGGGFGSQLVGIGLSGTSPFMDGNGKAITGGEIGTADGRLTLNIPAGTYVWNSAGAAQSFFSASIMTEPPQVPVQQALLLAYELGPNGVTFNPPITLTFTYTDGQIPFTSDEGRLAIAWWNGTEWVYLETTMDRATNTVSAKVSHFTGFALLALPAPQSPPQLLISTPATNTTFEAGGVTLSIIVNNLKLVAADGAAVTGEGRIVYYLDVAIPTRPGQSALTAPGTFVKTVASSNTWLNLSPGAHSLGVQLVQNDNTPFDPPIYSTVSIMVNAPAAIPTVDPAASLPVSPINGNAGSGGLNPVIIFGLLAVVLAVAFMVYLRRMPRPAANPASGRVPARITGYTGADVQSGQVSPLKAAGAAMLSRKAPAGDKTQLAPQESRPLGDVAAGIEEAGDYLIRLLNFSVAASAGLREYIQRTPNIRLASISNCYIDIQLNISLKEAMPLIRELSGVLPQCRVSRSGRIILITANSQEQMAS